MLVQMFLGGNKAHQKWRTGTTKRKRTEDGPHVREANTREAVGQHEDDESENEDGRENSSKHDETSKGEQGHTNLQGGAGGEDNDLINGELAAPTPQSKRTGGHLPSKITSLQAADRKKAAKVVQNEREREKRREIYNNELKNASTATRKKGNITQAKPKEATKSAGKGKDKAHETDGNKPAPAQRGAPRRNPLRESTAGPSKPPVSKAAVESQPARTIKKRKVQHILADPE